MIKKLSLYACCLYFFFLFHVEKKDVLKLMRISLVMSYSQTNAIYKKQAFI